MDNCSGPKTLVHYTFDFGYVLLYIYSRPLSSIHSSVLYKKNLVICLVPLPTPLSWAWFALPPSPAWVAPPVPPFPAAALGLPDSILFYLITNLVIYLKI
jgi:hypothetical protein